MKHFALWPLAQAAESCFGTDQWPGNLPVPQAWIEFDVENIEKATAELKSRCYQRKWKHPRAAGMISSVEISSPTFNRTGSSSSAGNSSNSGNEAMFGPFSSSKLDDSSGGS